MKFPVVAIAALAIARLLPESGAGLYLRLASATAVALLPGFFLARALRVPGASATLVWTLAALAGAFAVTFIVHASLPLAVVLAGAVALGALPLSLRLPSVPRPRGWLLVGGLGVLYGIALWQVAGAIDGDALFHLGRTRKLVELDDLGLAAVGEFADGSLHPGYAFPLWHGFLAVVSWLAGVDPGLVVLHESSVLVPLAVLVAYEAGLAVFGSPWLAGGVVAAQLAMISFASSGGGAYRVLELPATSSRQLLVPAALALVFRALDEPRRAVLASIGASALVLVLVHPSYAPFLLIPLGGFLVVRLLLRGPDVRPLALALTAFAVPTLFVVAALYPVVRETAAFTPSAEAAATGRHGVERYAGQLDVFADGSFRLAPAVLGRTGAVAVAALLLVPLAAFAARRRWGAFVLGGSLAVLALMLVPDLFSRFSDLVSLSQARRAAGFLPFAFAFAGGIAVLARLLGPLVVPLGLAAGVALQLVYPGDFGYRLDEGGPAWATWIAAVGGAAALAVAVVLRRPAVLESRGALAGVAALLFVAPVAVHAVWNWDAPAERRAPLPEGLVEALPERAVVLSDVETSYQIAAAAPVYVVGAPPAHVADTPKNQPYERRRQIRSFLRTGNLAVARRWRAGWIVIDTRHFDTELELPRVYEDERYVLYRNR